MYLVMAWKEWQLDMWVPHVYDHACWPMSGAAFQFRLIWLRDDPLPSICQPCTRSSLWRDGQGYRARARARQFALLWIYAKFNFVEANVHVLSWKCLHRYRLIRHYHMASISLLTSAHFCRQSCAVVLLDEEHFLLVPISTVLSPQQVTPTKRYSHQYLGEQNLASWLPYAEYAYFREICICVICIISWNVQIPQKAMATHFDTKINLDRP